MATRSVFFEERRFGTLRACPEVISSLYADYYHHVLHVCRHFFHLREDAEDAASEVFLKLHTILHKKDEAHAFKPWICQVAGRHCLDKLRRRKREKCAIEQVKEPSAIPDRAAPSPLSLFLQNETELRLREQLDRLPDCYRVPLMLRYYQGMSYSQIASNLNRRLPTVRGIIFRAKKRLRRNLFASTKAPVSN
ncbi:MAG TPA: sigma-70 family RNA polymerase sigma factor [Candidatus Eisenbacteria bacterium]|nr:sigma-70 family RNA polymerase sigma factor [Candidatus Eisenbacteria bacterium]